MEALWDTCIEAIALQGSDGEDKLDCHHELRPACRCFSCLGRPAQLTDTTLLLPQGAGRTGCGEW